MSTLSRADTDLLHGSGLNLVRIVIASYFMAAALGLIEGTNAGPLLTPWLGQEQGTNIGGAFTFLAAYFLLCGIAPKVSAVLLVSTVLSANVAGLTGGVDAALGQLDHFWRDMAMTCSLILIWMMPDSRTARRRRSIIRKKPKLRRIQVQQRVVPRRVRPTVVRSNGVRKARLVAIEKAPAGLSDVTVGARVAPRSAGRKVPREFGLHFLDTDFDDEAEILNIFAEEPAERAA